MALQACPRPAAYRQDVIGMEEGNDELEEGEAFEPNDTTDLNFPHLELKLAEVLGHARKDFEGGIYAEKLGSKFGGYGTFLPTVPAAPPPPPTSGRRSPLWAQTSPEAVKRENGIVQSKSEDVKKPFTLRIKMGPDVRAKNAAIYNKLGFSSPSISEDDEDEEISSPESPDRSPASMIQFILSHRPPPLLSPLPDLIQKEKPTSKTAKACERKQQGRREVSVDDSGKGDTEQMKQSKAGRLHEDANRAGIEAGKVLSKKENRQGVKAQVSLEEASSDKRKFKDGVEFESLKKRHKSNSSTGSIETNASKEGKKHRKQPLVVLPEEKKKAKVKAEAPEAGLTKARATKVVKKSEPQQPAAFLIPDAVVAPPAIIKENWVECEECHQWRLLPPTMDPPSQADTWLCSMSTWLPPGMNNCSFTEEQTTNALYTSLGISQCPVPVDPASATLPPLPVALPATEPKLVQTKKASDGKLGRTPQKKRDKPPKQQLVTEDANEEKRKKKKKRPLSEEPPVAKKIKSEEGLQRGKHAHTEEPCEMDEDDERGKTAKTMKKEKHDEDKKEKMKKEKHDEDKKEKMEEREETKERRRHVEDLPGKVSKYIKPDKISRGKTVPEARHSKAQACAKLSNDGTEQKRKKNLSPPSPCDSVDAFRIGHDSAQGLNFVDKEFRKNTYDEENHYRSLDLQSADLVEHETYGAKHFKEWQEDSSWDEADKKQRTWDRDDRYRDENDERDRDLDSKWEKREDRHREEKNPKKSIRRVEGGEVRLKYADALKGEHEEGRVGKDNTDDSRRKGAVECLEGKELMDRKDASSLASNAIKAATNLKHTADRLKDETATDIYLQAALKFLQGAALMESVTLYNDTAVLFKYCAGQYERANDMPGAVLAYKCAAVARFRLVMVKNPSMSRDRADLQAALHRAPAANQPTPATGESPSSSSASDLDNLNSQVIPVEKIFSSVSKGTLSPLVQGSESVPAALQPTLDRFVRNTADVFDAFDVWNKADCVLAAVVTAKGLSSDKLTALEKVGSVGFSDVEALVRLVNQALEALGR